VRQGRSVAGCGAASVIGAHNALLQLLHRICARRTRTLCCKLWRRIWCEAPQDALLQLLCRICASRTLYCIAAVAPHLVWRRAGLSVAPQLRDGACFRPSHTCKRLLASLMLYLCNRQGLPVAAVAPVVCLTKDLRVSPADLRVYP
jgi:hypothetical protein